MICPATIIYKLVVLIASLAAVHSDEALESSESVERDASYYLIVGGEPAVPAQFPYQVSLQYFGRHRCGGSIIDTTTVLTAAHCCAAIQLPQYATIIAGDYDRWKDDGTEQESTVEKIQIHEDNDPGTFKNDICIIKLGKPLQFDDYVQPIALPSRPKQEPQTGSKFIVSGWGRMQDGSLPDILQWAWVPYIKDKVCRKIYWMYEYHMLCAGYSEGGIDACQGDSGGPLVDATRQTLLGITSFGFLCAQPGFPGVYVQVSHFLDWIAANRNSTD